MNKIDRFDRFDGNLNSALASRVDALVLVPGMTGVDLETDTPV